MSTTFFEKPADKKAAFNPLGVKGIDHVEFIVDNADQWRDFFVQKYGMAGRFYADESTGVPGRRAHVRARGPVASTSVVSSGLRDPLVITAPVLAGQSSVIGYPIPWSVAA